MTLLALLLLALLCIAHALKVPNLPDNVKKVVQQEKKKVPQHIHDLTQKLENALNGPDADALKNQLKDKFNSYAVSDINNCPCAQTPAPAPTDAPTPAPTPAPADGNVNAGAQPQPSGVFKMTNYGDPNPKNMHCQANNYHPAAFDWNSVPGEAGQQLAQGNWVALTETLMKQIPPYGGALGTADPGCGTCVISTGTTKAGKTFTSPKMVVMDMCNTTPGNPWFDQNCVNIPNNIDYTTSAFNLIADSSCGEVYEPDGCGSNLSWQWVEC